MRRDDAEPEAEKRVVDLVEAAPALLLRFAEWNLATQEAHPDQAVERSSHGGRRPPEPTRDLGNPVRTCTDDVEDRPQLRRRRNLFEEHAIGLAVEDAERVEDEVLELRQHAACNLGSELPIARDASPRRMQLDEVDAGRDPEGSRQKAGGERTDLEHLARPSVERSVAGEHEALHHPLAGAGERDDETGTLGVVIEPALQEARQLG